MTSILLNTTLHISSGIWCLSVEMVPTCARSAQSTVHWPSEAFLPASSWPALSVCDHHSSGPSCSPPGWWEHWDRSASPQASTSQGYFLSRERQEVSWNTRQRGREREGGAGTIKRDKQCRVTAQNTSHDGLLCRLLEAKMFLAALILLPIKSIKAFNKQLA